MKAKTTRISSLALRLRSGNSMSLLSFIWPGVQSLQLRQADGLRVNSASLQLRQAERLRVSSRVWVSGRAPSRALDSFCVRVCAKPSNHRESVNRRRERV